MKAIAAAAAIGFTGANWFRSRDEVEAFWTKHKDAFSQKEFQSYKLVSVEPETHDAKRFRFALCSSRTRLNMPIASCITLRYVDDKGQEVMRPYTPLNLSDDEGHFDLVVKSYPGSKMGSHLFGMKVGDSIEAKGPWHSFDVKAKPYTQIGMIAGGTGITPMYQIINNVLHDGSNTAISLLYSNKTEGDIILAKELDEMAKKYPGKFATHHTVTTPPRQWGGYTGHITKEMIKETMPGPERKTDACVLVSGPPGFMKTICGPKDYSSYPPKQGALTGYLSEMGYDASSVFKF